MEQFTLSPQSYINVYPADNPMVCNIETEFDKLCNLPTLDAGEQARRIGITFRQYKA